MLRDRKFKLRYLLHRHYNLISYLFLYIVLSFLSLKSQIVICDLDCHYDFDFGTIKYYYFGVAFVDHLHR